MAKTIKKSSADTVWALSRISLGFIFLWAFFDKLIGLGFSTCRDAATGTVEIMCSSAWLEGGSPTTGFLKFGTSGPLVDFYQSLAGNPAVDWLFMIGLLGIGVGLILGIGMRLATISGVAMMLMMYSAALPSSNNPVIDDHIIYSLLLIGLLKVNSTQVLGFGSKWAKTNLVKKFPILS